MVSTCINGAAFIGLLITKYMKGFAVNSRLLQIIREKNNE